MQLLLALIFGLIGLAGAPQPAAALDEPPTAPGLLAPAIAACTPFGLQLTWSASSDDVAVDHYEVLIARSGQLPELVTIVAAGSPQPPSYTTFVDGNGAFALFDGQSYSVTIRAVDSSAQSTPSVPQIAMMAPSVPGAVAATQARLSGAQVQLAWSTQPAACAFAVDREGTQIAVLPAGSTAYIDGAPMHGRSTYAIRALGRGAASAAGSVVIVTEPLPVLGSQPTCKWRTTAISSRRLAEVSVASVCLLNYQRVRAGLQPVWVDARLQAAAIGHARDEAARNFFEHVNPDGCSPSCRASIAGYPQGAGENIYAGVTTAAEAVDGWMRSPGHRANILAGIYRTIGSGTAIGGPDGRQWVHDFGFVGAPITAVSGLEAQFQGAADPDAGGSTPSTGSAKSSARLRVTSARLSGTWRLRLTATVTRRANGGHVRVTVRGRGRSKTYTARISAGRARLSKTLALKVRARRMTITVSYAGSRRVRSAKVTLRFS